MPLASHRSDKPERPVDENGEEVTDSTVGKKPTKSLRWSVASAALEFGVNKGQLSKRLKQQSLEPGADGRYTTVQMAQAIYGDYHAERARKLREDADGSALDNAKRRNELVSKELVFKFCAGIGINVRQKILGSPLMDEKDKEDILHEIKDLFDAGVITQHIESH